MLCPGCGSELPDSARSCSKCGTKFSIDVPEPISMDTDSQERQVRKLLIVGFLALMLAGAGWYAWSGAQRSVAKTPLTRSSGGEVRIRQTVASSTINLYGNRFVSFPFLMPPGSRDAILNLDFVVSSSGVAEVLVLDEKGLASWKSTGTANAVYRSGRLGRVSTKVQIPSTLSRAFLILHNPSSSPQSVRITSSLESVAANH